MMMTTMMMMMFPEKLAGTGTQVSFVCCDCVLLQVTLSIELNDSQVDEFEGMIPVQLAQPPWNYTLALNKGITVHVQYITHSTS